MARRAAPAVYTIPAGLSFVDALVEGLLARHGDGAAALARVTVLVPTRRAAKTLSEAFLRRSGGRATLLPVMRPIGDVEEDEVMILAGAAGLDLDLPPAAVARRAAVAGAGGGVGERTGALSRSGGNRRH